MIQKVAEVFVLKRQFSISGLVTREELDYEPATAGMELKQSDGLPGAASGNGKQDERPISEAQAKRIFAIAGKGNEWIVKVALDERGYESSRQVKRCDYEAICARIPQIAAEDQTQSAADKNEADQAADIFGGIEAKQA
jgi:hypothetical protein